MAVQTRILPCQRCVGGQLLPDWNGLTCLQCGAEHDKTGKLKNSKVRGYKC